MGWIFESPGHVSALASRISIPLNDLASDNTLLGIQKTGWQSVR